MQSGAVVLFHRFVSNNSIRRLIGCKPSAGIAPRGLLMCHSFEYYTIKLAVNTQYFIQVRMKMLRNSRTNHSFRN